jgi:glucose/arabinose dehydrogenase
MTTWRRVALSITAVLLAGAGTATADTSTDPPVADPVPGAITMSGLDIRLEHVVTIPTSSGTGPLTRIITIANAGDGSDRLFVPDMRGDIWVVNGNTPTVYLDVPAHFPDFTSDRGLSSGTSYVAFHPDFATNGRFYTSHTEDGAALTAHTPDFPHQLGHTIHGVITEWTATNPAANVFSGTSRELMRIGFVSDFHGLQQVEFGPDDLLYIGAGDGDSTTFSTGAQSLDRAQGKLLRIDPDGTNSANGAYGIPGTNPFVGTAGAVEEIYALGFRNPHRFTWDAPSGKLLLGNIGQANVESVYQILPGANHGWNEREGPFLWDPANPDNVYPLPPGDSAFGYTYPVAMYDHDEGWAITGGAVHRHASVPELYGEYIFGDIAKGRVFHASETDMVIGTAPAPIGEIRLFDETDTEVTLLGLSGTSRVDLRFGADEDGTMLLLSKQTGDIYRLTSHNPQPLPTVTPVHLGIDPEGDSGSTVIQMAVELSAPAVFPVTVDYSTLDVPSQPAVAASGSDHVATSGTLTFAPGEVVQHFPIEILGDTADEAPLLWGEWGLVQFSNHSNATPYTGGLYGLGIFVIIDDD